MMTHRNPELCFSWAARPPGGWQGPQSILTDPQAWGPGLVGGCPFPPTHSWVPVCWVEDYRPIEENIFWAIVYSICSSLLEFPSSYGAGGQECTRSHELWNSVSSLTPTYCVTSGTSHLTPLPIDTMGKSPTHPKLVSLIIVSVRNRRNTVPLVLTVRRWRDGNFSQL